MTPATLLKRASLFHAYAFPWTFQQSKLKENAFDSWPTEFGLVPWIFNPNRK